MFVIDERGILRFKGWRKHSWLVHGFSTRATGDFLQWPEEGAIAEAFGVDGFGTATLRQVHSGRWVRANGPWGGERPEADAVVTDCPGVLVGVRTADCVPVLLADPVAHSVAAVHAGWRGAVDGVLPNAVRALCSEYGSQPANIEVVIGPGIGACCFEVGEEVASRFVESVVSRARPRPHVDLVAALELQLREVGVSTVVSCRDCTSCGLDRYYSHRAESGVTGRMLAAAGLMAGACR